MLLPMVAISIDAKVALIMSVPSSVTDMYRSTVLSWTEHRMSAPTAKAGKSASAIMLTTLHTELRLNTERPYPPPVAGSGKPQRRSKRSAVSSNL